MLELGCQELATLVDGRLQLGTMPPLGGPWEPVGRMVTRCRDVQPGDLFWNLHGEVAEAAFALGATGVVSSRDRPATSWDGTFAIHVDDTFEALCRLAKERRAAFNGRLVLVAGPESRETCRRIHSACGFGIAGPQIPLAPLQGHSDTTAELLFSLVELAPSERVAVVAWESDLENFSLDEISHLCCPHLICITSLPNGKTRLANAIHELLEGLPDDGLLIAPDHPGLPRCTRLKRVAGSAARDGATIDWIEVSDIVRLACRTNQRV